MKLKARYLLSIFSAIFSLPLYAQAQHFDSIYPVWRYIKTDATPMDYKLGFKRANGKQVIDYIYDVTGGGSSFIDGQALVSIAYKQGVIDTNGKVLIPLTHNNLQRGHSNPTWWWDKTGHDSIEIFDAYGHIFYEGLGTPLAFNAIDRIMISYGGGRFSQPFTILMDDKFNKLAEFTAKEDISILPLDQQSNPNIVYNKKVLMLRRGNSGALLDTNGKVIFDSVVGYAFTVGEMLLAGKNKAAVIDTNIKQVIPFSLGFKRIECMYGTPYYYVYKDSLSGIIDRSLKMVVELKIKNQQLIEWAHDWFVTQNEGSRTYYYYNYKGEMLFESKSKMYTGGNTKYPIAVKKTDTTYQCWLGGYIGKAYNFISAFNSEGYAYFYDGKKNGILDSNGKEIFTIDFSYLAMPENGIPAGGEKTSYSNGDSHPCAQTVSVLSNTPGQFINQFFYLDMKGKKLNMKTYDWVFPYYYGQALVSKDCATYLINKDGSLADKNDVIFSSHYSNGVRIVKNKQNQQALMDKKGKIVSPWVSSFNTKEGTTSSYIFFDKGYVMATASMPKEIPDFKKGTIIFEQDKKYGLMDSLGRITTKPAYSAIRNADIFYLVSDGKLQGIADMKGNLLIKPEYEQVDFHSGLDYFLAYKKKEGEPEIILLPK